MTVEVRTGTEWSDRTGIWELHMAVYAVARGGLWTETWTLWFSVSAVDVF